MVYHYCSVATFFNIIKNRTLRMSDIFKSTDKMEAKALLKSVKNKIYEIYVRRNELTASPIYGMEKNEAFQYILKNVIDKMERDSSYLYYVTCFSEKSDLIGQWREYGDKGKGVAIGFDEKWFDDLCQISQGTLIFKKVEYEYKNQNVNEIISERAEKIYEDILSLIANNNTKNIFDNNNAGSYELRSDKEILYEDSIFIKSKEYAPEQEYRLVLGELIEKYRDDWDIYYNWRDLDKNSDDLICRLFPNALEFMEKNGDIVSYMDLRYDILDVIPIKEIILGASCKIKEDDVYHFLSFHGYDAGNINILKSKSSYDGY